MVLNDSQEKLCSSNAIDYSDLRAVLVNTSLKPQPSDSHTQLLLNVVGEIMRKSRVTVDHIHMLSYRVPPGVYPDMTEHGYEKDDWPALWKKIDAAHILVVGTPLCMRVHFSLDAGLRPRALPAKYCSIPQSGPAGALALEAKLDTQIA